MVLPQLILTSIGEVRNHLGCHVNLRSAVCTACSSGHIHLLCAKHPQYIWAYNIVCVNCCTAWTICVACRNHRSKMTKAFLVTKHNKLYHRNCDPVDVAKTDSVRDSHEIEFPQDVQDLHVLQHVEESDVPQQIQDEDVPHDVENVDVPQDLSLTIHSHEGNDYVMSEGCDVQQHASKTGSPALVSYGNLKSTAFFEQDRKGVGAGSTYLVTRAITETPVVLPETLHPRDISYHMKVGNFVMNLTRAQREQFSEIISRTAELALVTPTDATKYLLPSLPRTRLFIDSVYIRGAYSLLHNLPHPTVTVVDNHGYVSLVDCIAHLLSFYDGFTCYKDDGMDNNIPSSITKLTESIAINRIRDRAVSLCGSKKVVILYCTEWSDNFDPSVSTKANRQSCWVKTAAVLSCNVHDVIDKMNTTYPIAVGKKGLSHEAVELKFAEDLQKLRSGTCSMYCKSAGEVVTVYLELLLSLQDQPERRGANYLMLGSGKYSARWGYSGNLTNVVSNIPTCTECLERLQHIGTTELPYCPMCTNWYTCSDHLLLRSDPPQNYPRDALTHGQQLSPFQLTYSILQEAVTMAHNQLTRSTWTTEQAKMYLWVRGVNNEAVAKVTEHALNERIYAYAEMHQEDMPRQYHYLKLHKERFPQKYQKWAYPATWTRQVDLDQHIDVPMHLLFLGVTKTTIKRIMEWTKYKNKHNSFLRMTNGVLESVTKLHIDWCVTIALNGVKFGGWVSENYLAMARLSRWYFSTLPHLRSGPEYTDPETPYTTWSVKELRDWLRVRSLPTTGKKSDLVHKVGGLLSSPPIPPILPPKGGAVDDILTLTKALSVAIGNIMQRTVTPSVITRTTHYIKRFLSAYHDVDRALIKENEKPGWLTSYNFLCLLNIPDLMRQYGPIPNLWEGGYDGERYSQELKHRLKGRLKENWHKNLLTNVLTSDTMNRIQLPCHSENDAGNNNKKSRSKSYKNYKKTYVFQQQYTNRAPLSVVCQEIDNGGL